jgi:hypothetical protein
MVHECRFIAAIENSQCPGYWIGLFYLTLSEISAVILSLEIKKPPTGLYIQWRSINEVVSL